MRKSRKQLRKDVWEVFSKYIRRRDCLATTDSLDWGECITCNETKEFNELDAGHFTPANSNNLLSFLNDTIRHRRSQAFGR